MSWMRWVGVGTRGRWGVRVLGVWLLVFAALTLKPDLLTQYRDMVLALLAIVAGVLLLLDR